MRTRIKELRQEKKYTQEFLALQAGTNQALLSRIECGLAVPDADLIVRLSAALHVSADYLLCLSDQRRPACNNAERKINTAIWQKTLFSLLQRLSPNQRIHLLRFLESMEGAY